MFRRKAALGLSFRTEAPDGLLLFRAPANLTDNEVDDDDGDDKHYLALFMVNGKLENFHSQQVFLGRCSSQLLCQIQPGGWFDLPF